MFRFETLDIWERAIEIAEILLDIADELDKRKLFRFADQLRGAALSMSNNIAEGSGSNSSKEFNSFLNIARRSAFENANMLIVFERRGYISLELKMTVLGKLDEYCRMTTSLIARINRNRASA